MSFGGRKWARKLTSICTLLKRVILKTLNHKQELWGAQSLNFQLFSCPSSSSYTGTARQCWRLGARCLREACGCLQVCCWLQEWLLCYLDGDFFIIFLTSVVHLSMARITIPEGIVGWCIDDARWGKAPFGTFQIKQLSVYDTVIWRWFTQPCLPSGCHLPSLHRWALRLGCSLTT